MEIIASLTSEDNEFGIRGLTVKGVIDFVEWIDNYFHSVGIGVWATYDGEPFGDDMNTKYTTTQLLDYYLSEEYKK
jgi:hypothetical protein